MQTTKMYATWVWIQAAVYSIIAWGRTSQILFSFYINDIPSWQFSPDHRVFPVWFQPEDPICCCRILLRRGGSTSRGRRDCRRRQRQSERHLQNTNIISIFWKGNKIVNNKEKNFANLKFKTVQLNLGWL